jgi:DNA-binding IclR family transcriptional regulator
MARQSVSSPPQSPDATSGGQDGLFVEAAARAFRVLEAFAERPGPMSLGEIAAATGLGRSAVQRSAHTLLRLGYLRQAGPRGGLLPGLRILDRNLDCMRSDPLVGRAVPFLIDLRRETQERVDLAIFDELTLVYVIRLQARRETFLAGLAGARIPTYCSSGGRAVLSALAPVHVDDILARSERKKLTPHTVTGLPGIRERIAAARRLGYAMVAEELQLGILSIAAPILGRDGVPLAAVQVTASCADHDPEELARRAGPLVVEAARSITAA